MSGWQAEILWLIPGEPRGTAGLDYDLPHLEFRTPNGRWAGLVGVPYGGTEGSSNFIFSPFARQILKKAPSWQHLDFEEWVPQLQDIIVAGGDISLSVEELIADLRRRVQKPREASSILWSPKLWTPREQTRQQALLETALKPYFERWKANGICLDDLNPSEFEDLVA